MQNHGNMATPILKYLNNSENYYKKKDEYFSIILFAMCRLYIVNIVQNIFLNFAKHGYPPRRARQGHAL